MIIQIQASTIEDLLDQDECLIPAVEDLLLDTLIEYRDTTRGIYEPRSQITNDDQLNIRIVIKPSLPRFIKMGTERSHRNHERVSR